MDNNKEEHPDDLLSAGDAAKYLRKKWGREEEYSTVAFRQLRWRWGLKPAMLLDNATLWRRGDLDEIPEPSRSNPRPSARKPRKKRTKKPDESIDNGDGSMLFCAI